MEHSEPRFLYPDGQNYDCLMCAKGCRQAWDVDVEPESVPGIRQSRAELRVIQESGQSGLLEEKGSYTVRKSGGRCVYLRGDQLCALHAEEGFEVKPASCQEFPFTFVETPEGIVVGVSYFCTAIQENHGRPLLQQRSEIEDLYFRHGSRRRRLDREALLLTEDRKLTWAEYSQFEANLLEELQERSPVEALDRALATILARSRSLPEGSRSDGHQQVAEALRMLDTVRDETEYFAYCLLGVIESEVPSLATSLAQRFLSGEPVQLHEAEWTGCMAELSPVLEMAEGLEFEQWLRPFFRMVVHRKSLLLSRPLLPSLVLLRLTVILLRLYSALACLGRSGQRLAFEDFRKALDRVERDFVAHAQGFEPLLEFYSQFYLARFDESRTASD